MEEKEFSVRQGLMDEIGGGSEEDHSREDEVQTPAPEDGNHEAGETHEVPPEDGESPEDSGNNADENGGNGGNGDAKTAPADDNGQLKAENERLRKRLHDTQAAFHRETKHRAELAKELDELKKQEGADGDNDDWFAGDEEKKAEREKLETQLKESDERIARQSKEIDEQTAAADMAAWDEAAAPVEKKYSDFKQLVYDELGSLLNTETGDPEVRKKFLELPAEKRTPEEVYKFAKSIHEQREFMRDPEAYREKIRKEVLSGTGENGGDDSKVSGKELLDMTNGGPGYTRDNSIPDDPDDPRFFGRKAKK